jgi:putative NADH-flavin reductase
MKVVLYGASGRAGSRILNELIERGHEVTGIARYANGQKQREDITTANDDLSDVSHVLVVSSVFGVLKPSPMSSKSPVHSSSTVV